VQVELAHILIRLSGLTSSADFNKDLKGVATAIACGAAGALAEELRAVRHQASPVLRRAAPVASEHPALRRAGGACTQEQAAQPSCRGGLQMQRCARFAAVAAVIAGFACGGSSASNPRGSGGPPASSTATLSVTVSGAGSVTSNPAGIDCGATCSMTFAQGTSVVLTAAAGSGQDFTGWSGACTGTGTCTVMLNADTAASAQFAAMPVTTPPTVPPTTPPPTTPPPTNPPPTAPPDECAGLLPAALPAPVKAQLPKNSCLEATSDDGAGNYLLGYEEGSGPFAPTYLFFKLENGQAVQVGGRVNGGDETGTYIYSQPSGFTVFSVFGENGASAIASYGSGGDLLSSQVVAPGNFNPEPSSAVGIDPSGGTATLKHAFDAATSTWTTAYKRYDKTGAAETGEVVLEHADRPAAAIGVTLSGNALAVVTQSTGNWQARWLARDGKALTDWFALSGPADRFAVPVIRFLLDGSLAVGFRTTSQGVQYQNLDYRYRVLDGATATSLLPAWLASRANDVFFAIRGGRGYAAFGAQGSCGAGLEVLAASGKSCGCMNVPLLDGGAAGHGASSIGRDGSLMVAEPVAACVWDVYPQLFQ